MMKIGIVTVSDRASRGEYEDLSGPAVMAELERYILSKWETHVHIVPDERDEISAALVELSEVNGCSLIITTGGTGPAPRDITPEATRDVLEKELPGLGEAMRAVSLKKVPTAVLSRQIAGIRGSTLIINLPGSPKAIAECLEAVIAAVPDCMDLIGAPDITLDPSLIHSHRPHKLH